MSDNDLINRGKVRHEIAAYIYYNTALVDEWAANCIDDIVEEIPAVPQEMSAREYGETLMKICASHKGKCHKCELEDDWQCATPNERTIPIVEEWAREHPETDMMTAKYALPRIDFKGRSEE